MTPPELAPAQAHGGGSQDSATALGTLVGWPMVSCGCCSPRGAAEGL